MISLFIISMIGIFMAIIINIIENIFHAYKPRMHVSIKEANNMKLQILFMKLQNNFNDDEFFHESPITMRTLIKEIQNHNDLLINVSNTGLDEESEQKLEDQDTSILKKP